MIAKIHTELTQAPFGLQPLGRTWHTFPGAKLTNGWGLKDVGESVGQ